MFFRFPVFAFVADDANDAAVYLDLLVFFLAEHPLLFSHWLKIYAVQRHSEQNKSTKRTAHKYKDRREEECERKKNTQIQQNVCCALHYNIHRIYIYLILYIKIDRDSPKNV